MASDSSTGSSSQELEAFRNQQEEMLSLSQEYSRSRLAAWNREVQQMQETWTSFTRDWQGSLEEMSSLAQASFDDLASRGEAAGNSLSQSLKTALGEISGDLNDLVDDLLRSLEKVGASWSGIFGSSGSGENWLSWLGSSLGFGGLFHQGGIVSAHQGLTVSSGAGGSDEQLILAQSGEGILPRDSMTRLGGQNFEALRSGQFELAPSGGSKLDVTIQVQTLDTAGANRVNWDRLVQRHIRPLLQKEADRRW